MAKKKKKGFDRMMNPHDGSRKRGSQTHESKNDYSRMSAADLKRLREEAMLEYELIDNSD